MGSCTSFFLVGTQNTPPPCTVIQVLILYFLLIIPTTCYCSIDFNYPVQSMSRFTGLQFTGLPCLPVFFFRATPSPRFTGGMPGYRGGSFFTLAEPLLLLHTPTHAAAHNTTQHAGCCGQQPTLAYTPCHVRQENYANLVTALPPRILLLRPMRRSPAPHLR